MALGEVPQGVRRARVLHAAPGNDDRPAGCGQQLCGCLHLARIGRLAADLMDALGKERLRIVIAPSLHVLRETEKYGPAIGGIEQGCDGFWQRLDDLGRMGDPVPVARDALEGVIDRQRGVTEVLHLLQDRVGQPRDVGVAAEEENR